MDILVGPFGYFVYSAALNLSYRNFDSASETTVLNYTWPVFTVIFTQLVFKGLTRKDRLVRMIEWLGIGLGFLSVIVLASRGEFNLLVEPNLPGIGWGLLAGASYGFFSAYSGTVSRERQSIFY
jgi:drug/metabolite transporter (DMT)-like permease